MSTDVQKIAEEYGSDVSIATICSHSANQIFAGARREGIPTVGIYKTEEQKESYDIFPQAKPDTYMQVDDYKRILDKDFQDRLIAEHAVVIQHGSFVAYVGAKNIVDDFYVPIFGNKESLKWEDDRKLQRQWLEKEAKLRMPEQYDIDKLPKDKVLFVKFGGARGGRGFFRAPSAKELKKIINERKKIGDISDVEIVGMNVQEYVDGNRYYIHGYQRPLSTEGVQIDYDGSSLGQLMITGADRRDENNIDEIQRLFMSPEELREAGIEATYIVTGNIPIILRESLTKEAIPLFKRTVQSSAKLFEGGMWGPFCLETFCRAIGDRFEFVTFEISGRIVAGTNFYENGNLHPYTQWTLEDPCSVGQLMARDIKYASETGQLGRVVT